MIRNEVLPLRRLEEMFGISSISEIFLILHHQDRKARDSRRSYRGSAGGRHKTHELDGRHVPGD